MVRNSTLMEMPSAKACRNRPRSRPFTAMGTGAALALKVREIYWLA